MRTSRLLIHLALLSGLAFVVTSCGASGGGLPFRRDLGGDGGGGGNNDGGGGGDDAGGGNVDMSIPPGADLTMKPGDMSVPPLADLAKPPADLKPVVDLVGCGIDNDKDGVSLCQGDCDDNDPTVRPNTAEVCDGKDNNCNGQLDEGFDKDMDGWTTCAGDCNDGDPTIYPMAMSKCNGKDNNCNNVVDDNEDVDKDGYNLCTDCDDKNPGVNPGAFDVPGNNQDDNCNGQTDEPPPTCDANITFNSANPVDYAHAMDICDFLISAQFTGIPDSRARSVPKKWGTAFSVRKGVNMAAFSTGPASAIGDPNYIIPQPGTQYTSTVANPLPMGAVTCTDPSTGQQKTFQDPTTVYDYVEYRLQLRAPTNAESFSFDFNFLSAEYPEFVCTEYNDKFLVLLQSQKTNGNISFDAKGKAVTINNGFFSVTQSNMLTGTGMENGIGGATGWLTTTAPITPGETITLRFIIFDEGDHIYDSQVLLDNFRWTIVKTCGAMTGRGDGGTQSNCDGGM